MKIKIPKHEYKRVDTEIEVEVSEETIYCFQTGIRAAYSITPEWTTWNKEQYNEEETIFRYIIIEVRQSFENVISSYSISTSNIPDLIKGKSDQFRFICEKITGQDDYDMRTKERFEKDYQSAINKLQEALKKQQ